MKIKNITKINVKYKGELVGTIAITKDDVMAFKYADSWIADGFSISPLSMPLEKRVFLAKKETLDGVFGVFNDSLPDGWGRLLLDRTLESNGIDHNSVGILMRLSFVGSCGMGALEYEPESVITSSNKGIDFDLIAEDCAKILSSKSVDISVNDYDNLFALGGSSGGARPKILTKIDNEDWIVKFPSSIDGFDIGKDEYDISQLALKCGLKMSEAKLVPSKRCSGYFATKRFDRVNKYDAKNDAAGNLDKKARNAVEKIHMVSAGGLLETSHRIPNLDYEMLMRLMSFLSNDAYNIEQLYRLMCFNVFVGNRDDHAKNFSFLYNDKKEKWSLSPAYDITQNPGIYGERATTVNGKGKSIQISDLVLIGTKAGLSENYSTKTAKEIYSIIEDSKFLDCK